MDFLDFLKKNCSKRIGGGIYLDKEHLRKLYSGDDFDEQWNKAIFEKKIRYIVIGGKYAQFTR